VEDGRVGLDAGRQHGVEKRRVVGDAGGVDAAAGGAARHDARPGKREAVVLDAHAAHELEIIAVAVVVVARDVARGRR
jgi:hypothetical protein